jgi:hypothetical protein
VDELRPGHALRIGHAWYDDPFPASTFQIDSLLQIGVVREVGIKRLFIDLDKSTPASQDPANAILGLPLLHDTPEDLRLQISAEARRLTQEKANHVEWVGRARQDASEVGRHDQRCAREASPCCRCSMPAFRRPSSRLTKCSMVW